MTYISKLVAGTKFPAPIGLTDDQMAAGVALGDANLMRGGSHSYDTIAERNAIPLQRRSKGMLVSVWEGSKTDRPVNYVLKGAVAPGTPADFSLAGSMYGVPMYEEVYEKYLEANHPDYVEGAPQTTRYPTGNFYVWLHDIMPNHPAAATQDQYVRLYPSGSDGWFWFYADEPIQHMNEEEWYVYLGYHDFYDAGGNYAGYEGTFNNGYFSGIFYQKAAFLTATPGTAATGEQPDLMGLQADQSDAWVELSTEAPVVSVASFADMNQLVLDQKLTPHLYYLFPYRCRYKRPKTNEFVTCDYSETILAKAITGGTLEKSVKSVDFPQDTIFFDMKTSSFDVQGMEGQITFRRDELLALEAGYDWRAVQFARERFTGLDYDNATPIAAGYECTPRYTLVAANLPSSYREHQIRFTSLSHPASPTITMKRNLGGSHTTELKKADGTSLALNELATLLADSSGGAIVGFSPALGCYTVTSAYPEEAVLAGSDLGIVNGMAATDGYRTVRPLKNTAMRTLYYTFSSRSGTGCQNCRIEGFRDVAFLPNIVIGTYNVTNVHMGPNCYDITIIAGYKADNVKLGSGCHDIQVKGDIKGLHLGAGSHEVLVAGDYNQLIEILPRGAAATLVDDSAFIIAKGTTQSARPLEISYGTITGVQLRHRCLNRVKITFGYAEDVYLNAAAGWDHVALEYSYRKSWEWAAVWNFVTYVGSRIQTAADFLSVRDSLTNTLVIDSDKLLFPLAASSAVAVTPMVMDAQGNIFKWSGTIAEAATAGSIAKRDATGGLFATEFTMTSDARLKTDLEHIAPEEALELVRQLSGYYYRRNDIKNAPQEIGFLAQEVQDIAPQLTKGLPHHFLTDALGVNYARAVALLAPAIQALLGRIEQLEKGQ